MTGALGPGYEYTGKHRRATGPTASPPAWASTVRASTVRASTGRGSAVRGGRTEADGRLASGPGGSSGPGLRSQISARNDPGGRDAAQ
jgi:hypothetical protein